MLKTKMAAAFAAAASSYKKEHNDDPGRVGIRVLSVLAKNGHFNEEPKKKRMRKADTAVNMGAMQ